MNGQDPVPLIQDAYISQEPPELSTVLSVLMDICREEEGLGAGAATSDAGVDAMAKRVFWTCVVDQALNSGISVNIGSGKRKTNEPLRPMCELALLSALNVQVLFPQQWPGLEIRAVPWIFRYLIPQLTDGRSSWGIRNIAVVEGVNLGYGQYLCWCEVVR